MSNDALIDENLDYRYDITDTAYEQAKYMAESWEKDYQQEIAELKQQLAEKDQDKIEFCIAELEKVFSDFNHKVDNEFGDNDMKYITLDIEEVNFYLQDRIKQLREND
jgi:hypothetical protein